MRADVAVATATVGDEVALRLRISGRGNLAHFRAPGWSRLDGFVVQGQLDELRGGERVLTLALLPLRAGTTTVAGLEFAYFEPGTAQYRVEPVPAVPLRVLLVGVKLPPNYGEDYTRSFDNVFAEVAKSARTALVPFMLEGFAEKPEFFLPDRIHPTEEAQPLILERVWKGLRPLLK